MKVRIFCLLNKPSVEDEVNDWLIDHPNIEIKSLCQTEIPVGDSGDSYITLTFLYRERSKA